jgi:hypothetical protein
MGSWEGIYRKGDGKMIRELEEIRGEEWSSVRCEAGETGREMGRE